MPTRRSTNPGRAKPPASGNLPAHGKAILDAAYESAKKRAQKQGLRGQAAKRAASAQAWCAVKRHYYKRGSKWVKRRVSLGPDEHPPGCRPYRGGRRRNPMLSRQKRESLARDLGGGLRADATVDELLAYMRSIESSGRIAYDDDLEDDPTTPKPELEDLWDELWINYGEDLEANPRKRGIADELYDELALPKNATIEQMLAAVQRDRSPADGSYQRAAGVAWGLSTGRFSSRAEKEMRRVGPRIVFRWILSAPQHETMASGLLSVQHILGQYPERTSLNNPQQNPRDIDEPEEDWLEEEEEEEEEEDDYGRVSEYELHMAESDLVPNPESWVVIAHVNSYLWPSGPLEVLPREIAIDRLLSGESRGSVGVGPVFRTEHEARSYADKVEHTTIEVFRSSDGTIVYRGSLLGFSADPTSRRLKLVDRGRVIGLVDSQVETKLGTGKKALIARRDRSVNPRRFVRLGEERDPTLKEMIFGGARTLYGPEITPAEGERFQRAYESGLAAGLSQSEASRRAWETIDNPYLGDAVELAQRRKYEEARERWEKSGRRGPPPPPPRSRQHNPSSRTSRIGRRISNGG